INLKNLKPNILKNFNYSICSFTSNLLDFTFPHNSHIFQQIISGDGKAYVKQGSKSVHISKSGMVASDGITTALMDHYGRIIS
ncbi:unnamed protein product, partial [Dracunculus medinensis]|uniref:RNase H domain-containing protein n=1 Tax=Dracunculus medinensis TaxID=318479 RepID=A0A0N4UE88_DRAME